MARKSEQVVRELPAADEYSSESLRYFRSMVGLRNVRVQAAISLSPGVHAQHRRMGSRAFTGPLISVLYLFWLFWLAGRLSRSLVWPHLLRHLSSAASRFREHALFVAVNATKLRNRSEPGRSSVAARFLRMVFCKKLPWRSFALLDSIRRRSCRPNPILKPLPPLISTACPFEVCGKVATKINSSGDLSLARACSLEKERVLQA